MTDATPIVVHENMDTSYVNFPALLRYLQQRDFVGRVHVELIEYEADVYLNAHDTPRVREINHATRQQADGEEAMQRLLARAGEAGGLVNVYEGEDESLEGAKMFVNSVNVDVEDRPESDEGISIEDREWHELLGLSGELIAAVERAALSVDADFMTLFRGAKLELSDDYPFLDPLTECFEYGTGGVVRIHARPSPDFYVASICECLRRVVSAMAKGERGGRLRERVALELAIQARRRQTQLARFRFLQQLDRIAGTRVL